MYSAIDLKKNPRESRSVRSREPKRYIQPRSIEYLTGSACIRSGE